MSYLIPVGLFAVLGVVSGILLTAASKLFAVKTDERLDAVTEALPQVNCGACGYSGCADYARAVVEGAPCNLCREGCKGPLGDNGSGRRSRREAPRLCKVRRRLQ